MNELKKQVYEANMMLPRHNLVTFTWGNASGICREKNIVVIKPSGVEYEKLQPSDLVLVDLFTGKKIEGKMNPSSDTPTHLELYRRFPNIGGVVHTHSRWATIFSQAKKEIPALGTTHADYFHGAIPCTRLLSETEIKGDYELETGKLITETCNAPDEIPAVLVASHGPFTWGKDAYDAAYNAVVLEEVAFMAWHNLQFQPNARIVPIQQELLDKHYFRKHGANSYYGQ
ncbi:MAG: L-ribulose-5-phosphate 4-epimerase [Clostridiales bacterium]|jgi:L-ribulose-5-phosphate 4-epimerase|nr:L-ribulose-5-phosphate 4-epimerase [Clostridiales bacterium]